MKQTLKILLSLIAFEIIFSFSVNYSISQVTDKDGNVYKTVTIGNQEWMAENLNVSYYRNGDVIPQVQDADEWGKLTTGAWCYYENKSDNGKIYGKLYNWYAVNDNRGLAPKGWHVPTDAEWTQLTDYLGGVTKEDKFDDGTKFWYIENVGDKLKATTLWESPNEGGTNSSGFTAYPGGYRSGTNGVFFYIGKYPYFWSASETNYTNAWTRELYFYKSVVIRTNATKGYGFSVRCVRD